MNNSPIYPVGEFAFTFEKDKENVQFIRFVKCFQVSWGVLTVNETRMLTIQTLLQFDVSPC